MSKYVYGHRAEDFGEHRATAFENEAKHSKKDASSQEASITALRPGISLKFIICTFFPAPNGREEKAARCREAAQSSFVIFHR